MASLNMSSTLTTLIPPPVEPAQAPTKLAKINNTGSINGQSEKSTDANPVVVAIETP